METRTGPTGLHPRGHIPPHTWYPNSICATACDPLCVLPAPVGVYQWGMTLKRWTVTFTDAPDMRVIRAERARREAHIAFVRTHDALDIGGPLAIRPMQDFPGAIWTVTAETREDVQRIIHSDPFFVPRLRRYEITEMRSTPSVIRLFS